MYTITIYDANGIEKQVRRYSEKDKAMGDWDKTCDHLLPNEEKGVLRGPKGIMSEYSPYKWSTASYEHWNGL